MKPALLLDELRDLGECSVTAHTEAIPVLDKLKPDACFFAWDIIITTTHGVDAIKDVFIFVEEGSGISIDAIGNNKPEDIDEPNTGPDELLADRGKVSSETVDQDLKSRSLAGESPVDSESLSGDKVESALIRQKAFENITTGTLGQCVRVPSEKLDNLINLVGELVVTQARLAQVSACIRNTDLFEPLEVLERLAADLRDCSLDMRMLPIGTTFGKFRRLVRDLSLELGKEADLVTEGAETELDITIIERLNDPLVHLIRNCMDHAIESPEKQEQTGKPRKGTIRLAAAHRGARVRVSIHYDGRGMDPEIIRNKAVENGWISENTDLSESEIFDLIFRPGFSTAGGVTNVSGRGVGMDVVKRAVNAMGGTIRIKSEKGVGTSIHLYLPLTLAIIDGLLVNTGGRRFVLPVEHIEGCTELTRPDFEQTNGRNMIRVMGELIPFFRLGELFELPGERPAIEHMAVVKNNGFHVGIVMDEIIGNIQTVIKPLDVLYRDAPGISGATIMGDGTVSMILDVPELIECAKQEEKKYRYQNESQPEITNESAFLFASEQ